MINKPITFESLRNTIDQIRTRYPESKMLKEIRVHDHSVIKSLVSAAPKEDLPSVWGIPVIADPRLPYGVMKFVYRDGHTEMADV